MKETASRMQHALSENASQPPPDAQARQPARARLQRLRHWLRGAWPVLLILALPLLLLQHSLIGGGATTGGDILAQHPPWSADLAGQVGTPQNPALFDEPYEVSAWFLFTRHELLSGRFPFWNPYVAGGTPFFAAGQPAVLYPLTLLGILLPYPFSMTVMTLLKWWLAGLGMYLFARASLRLGQAAGLAAALSFMFSSFIVVWLVHPVGEAAMLLPWVLWASERVIHAPTTQRAAVLGVIVALIGFSGHPEMIFHVLLGASLYALWLIGAWGGQPWRARLRRLSLWVGGMALGVALAAIQLLPTIALLPQTLGTMVRADNYSGIGIPLQGVLTWLVPNLWGNPASIHSYWGPRNYNEEVWYAGAVALALAFAALLALRRRQRRAEIAFFALLVLIIAAMLYRIPPFIWLTRLPILSVDSWTRLGLLAILGVSALAGFGCEEVLAWGRSRPTRRATGWRGLLTLAGLVALLPLMLWATGHFWRPPRLTATQVAWEVHWIRLALAFLWGVALLALVRWHRWLNRRAVGGLLLGLLLCDHLLFAAPYTPQPAARLAYPQTPTLTRLQQTVGSARMAASGALLEPETSAPYQLRDLRAYDPTVSSRYVRFMLALDPGLGQTNAYCCQFLHCPSAVLLGVASVAFYATPPDEDPNRCASLAPGQAPAAGPYLSLWTQSGLTLWRNTLARPRWYFAGRVLPASNEQASLAALPALVASTLDAVIEGASALPAPSSASTDTISALTDLPGQIKLQTESTAPRWLIINEGYDPGWQATLDGAPAAIHPANVMFQAVLVPAGAHTLQLRYRPPAFVPALLLSLLALVALLGLLASEWVGRRLLPGHAYRRKPTGPEESRHQEGEPMTTRKQRATSPRQQRALLAMVRGWHPSPVPEYRGFRCASCQAQINEAWHHWLMTSEYLLPVHLCQQCQSHFQAGTLSASHARSAAGASQPLNNTALYPEAATQRFREIATSWKTATAVTLHSFLCDDCGGELPLEPGPDGRQQRQGYHVWWEMEPEHTRVELHFHRDCGHALGIYSQAERAQQQGQPTPPARAFRPFVLPTGERALIPADLELRVPEHTSLSKDLLHFLIYIPWNDHLLSRISPPYRAFFQRVLPFLHTRTTDVHVATCFPFARELIQATGQAVDERVIHLAFLLHDVGWSQLSEAEIAASLGVTGVTLSAEAQGPKEKHAQVGSALAGQLLADYAFDPPLTATQRAWIVQAVLYHDQPWELAKEGALPREMQLVCDVDHLWSFTHVNFWQDTVRKGVAPPTYLENLGSQLDGYLVTEPGKAKARLLLQQRRAEVAAWAGLERNRNAKECDTL